MVRIHYYEVLDKICVLNPKTVITRKLLQACYIAVRDDDSFEEATASHDKKLLALLKRCQRKNVKLNKKKFRLKKSELLYMHL